MEYRAKGSIIKSQNAAKSHLQKSKFLSILIASQNVHEKVLDFGCGKLRYFDDLKQISKTLYLHDSSIQLERIQTIRGKRTSITDFVKNQRRVFTVSADQFDQHNNTFDLILCSNVLSAIPSLKMRKQCLTNIKHLLTNSGTCLLACQYRNSFFNQYQTRAGADKHLDGYLYTANNNLHFYGMIKPQKLEALALNCGLHLGRRILKDGSVYLFLSK